MPELSDFEKEMGATPLEEFEASMGAVPVTTPPPTKDTPKQVERIEEKREVHPSEAIVQGVAQAATLGFADEAAAAAAAIKDILTTKSLDMGDFTQVYDIYKKRIRKRGEETEEAYPKLTTASDVLAGFAMPAGAAMSAAKQVGKIGKLKKLSEAFGRLGMTAKAAGTAATIGGVEAIGRSEDFDPQNIGGQMLASALIGGGMSKLIPANAKKIQQAQEDLLDQGSRVIDISPAKIKQLEKQGINVKAVQQAVTANEVLPQVFKRPQELLDNYNKIATAKKGEYITFLKQLDDDYNIDPDGVELILETIDRVKRPLLDRKGEALPTHRTHVSYLDDLEYSLIEKLGDDSSFQGIHKVKLWLGEKIKKWDVEKGGADATKQGVEQDVIRELQQNMDLAVAQAKTLGDNAEALGNMYKKLRQQYQTHKVAQEALEDRVRKLRTLGIKPETIVTKVLRKAHLLPKARTVTPYVEAGGKRAQESRYRDYIDTQKDIIDTKKLKEKLKEAPIKRGIRVTRGVSPLFNKNKDKE